MLLAYLDSVTCFNIIFLQQYFGVTNCRVEAQTVSLDATLEFMDQISSNLSSLLDYDPYELFDR